jgi:hypothetical protein
VEKSRREAESKRKRLHASLPTSTTRNPFQLGDVSEMPVQLLREAIEAREVAGRKDSWDSSAISEAGEESRAE